MLQQAVDFHAESDALHALIEPLKPADWGRKTLFKDWTINDVIVHLHFFNVAADLSLTDEDAFADLLGRLMTAIQGGEGHLAFSHEYLNHANGYALRDQWRAFYPEMAERFGAADPEARVKWAGPDMSVRMSITARQMETWAHGQAVFDMLGATRTEADRLKNIAVIGVKTYGWTFANRKMEPPGPPPYVRLTAPSGAVWEWNEPSAENVVEGDAAAFCQVVTQTRNIADTSLRVVGEPATGWMAIAQCFAGQPQDPPPPGTRG